jgi:hypothetical protein
VIIAAKMPAIVLAAKEAIKIPRNPHKETQINESGMYSPTELMREKEIEKIGLFRAFSEEDEIYSIPRKL